MNMKVIITLIFILMITAFLVNAECPESICVQDQNDTEETLVIQISGGGGGGGPVIDIKPEIPPLVEPPVKPEKIITINFWIVLLIAGIIIFSAYIFLTTVKFEKCKQCGKKITWRECEKYGGYCFAHGESRGIIDELKR